MPAQLSLPRNAFMHLILRIDCAQPKQHERETIKACDRQSEADYRDLQSLSF